MTAAQRQKEYMSTKKNKEEYNKMKYKVRMKEKDSVLKGAETNGHRCDTSGQVRLDREAGHAGGAGSEASIKIKQETKQPT